MQFMPCTFVGWTYPGCGGLGKGDIPEKDKTNPAIIKKYGGYGVDGNGDGIADPYDIEDAIYSAANYLSISGAADGDYKKRFLIIITVKNTFKTYFDFSMNSKPTS